MEKQDIVLTPEAGEEFKKFMARLDAYSDKVLKFASDHGDRGDFEHAVIGIGTEVGELLDSYKRARFYGKALDVKNVKEECGDVMWYIALGARAVKLTLSQVWNCCPGIAANWLPTAQLHEKLRLNVQCMHALSGRIAECLVQLDFMGGIEARLAKHKETRDAGGATKELHEKIETLEAQVAMFEPEVERISGSLPMLLGELMHRVALVAHAVDSDTEEVISINEAKLTKRYGDKFSADRAINRDTAAEAEAMESATA